MSAPNKEFLRDAIFLVDASSYIFRAYYAIQRPLTAPDGTPTHATYGFLQMVQSLVERQGLSHCVLVWDRPEKGFRHEVYPEYKANRTAPPEDLGVQIKNSREAAELLGLPQIDCAGFEADDILATIVHQHPKRNFVIVTADKDLLQLVGPHVWCLDTMKDKWSNVDEAFEKFGVKPHQIREVQALCGDSVDNVPGVPGVGPKTAAELMQTFGSLDVVLQTAADRIATGKDVKSWKDKLKGKCLENVAAHRDDAIMSLRLVSLSHDVPMPVDIEALSLRPTRTAEFTTWSHKLGFAKTTDRLLAMVKNKVAVSTDPSSDIPSFTPADEVAAATEDTPPAVKLDFTTRCLKNLEEFRTLLKQNHEARLVAMDTETFGLETMRPGNLVGLSLSFRDDEGIYIPLRHRDPAANLPLEDTLNLWHEYLRTRAQQSADFALVFQNAKFDLHALANDGFEMPREVRVDDTMVASFVLDPASKHGLDALSVQHLGGYRPMPFEEVTAGGDNFSEVDLEQGSFYAAEDAVVCRRLWTILAARLKAESLWNVYEGIDRPTIGILLEMERNGIVLDPSPLKEISRALHDDLKSLQHKAIASLQESGLDISEDLNLNSPKQVGVILYEKLKLPILKKNKTGPSTDVSVLEELAAQHPFPSILLEIREISKLLSTYVDALPTMINPATRRLHTDFSQTIAATGRLASSNPNLQNIPIKTARGRSIRTAFRAPPGRLLIGVDYSQIELRLLAHVSQDPELLRAFKENADVHKRTAALVLHKAESDVTEDDRRIAKTINYGIVYGQTAFGLAKSLQIPRQTAQEFIDGYFRTYSRIRGYMDAAIAEARKTGAVRTLTGRRRNLPEIHSKNGPVRQFAERMAINTPLQGLAADLMKVGMRKVSEMIRNDFPDTLLLLQVHDELVLEAPAEQAEAVKNAVVKVLEDRYLLSPFGVTEFSVALDAQASVGPDWGAL
ncbi:MAG: DNA polymerase I [Bdellovibrionales bacterium]|nr:DNA polymerase I [Bdellovibrionales bacterium]